MNDAQNDEMEVTEMDRDAGHSNEQTEDKRQAFAQAMFEREQVARYGQTIIGSTPSDYQIRSIALETAIRTAKRDTEIVEFAQDYYEFLTGTAA